MNSEIADKNNFVKIILFAGLLTGSLDILTAFIDYYIQSSKGPGGVLRFVASGVFGKEAFSGNSVMIFWGLFFHFIIAFSFTILFVWLYPRLPILQRNTVLSSILYGIFVWLVMNLIILPVSNAPKSPLHIFKVIKQIIILICMIGLPLSIIMKSFYKRPL